MTVSGQSGVRRFCWALTLDVVCSPRLVTATTCPRALDIVWSNGRGVNGVRTTQRPAVVGELGVRLRGPRRDLAVADRVQAPSGPRRPSRRRPRGDPAGAARSRSIACRLVVGQADQEAHLRRPVRRHGRARRAGCRSGRTSGARPCPRPWRTPASPDAAGVHKLRPRPMKSTRTVRNPSGADVRGEEAQRPWRACPRPARRAARGRTPSRRTAGCTACARGRRPAGSAPIRGTAPP